MTNTPDLDTLLALPPSKTRTPVQDLVQNDALRIRWLPGTSDRVVVVFGGVQHNLGGVPMDEFAGSVSQSGLVHVLFINDLNCTWYSATGLFDQIVSTVTDLVAQQGLSDLRTIGNSMGGYGAVLFADALNAKVAFALSPQISMDPDVIAETRWSHFRPAFGPELSRGLHVHLPKSSTQTIFTFGAQDRGDARQASLLPALDRQGSVAIFKVKGCGHDAVSKFKAAGELHPIVQAGLVGDLCALQQLYRRVEKLHRLSLRAYFAKLTCKLGLHARQN